MNQKMRLNFDEMLAKPISLKSLEIALENPIEERFSDSLFPVKHTATFETAQIASHLVKLVDGHIDGGTQIRIVGYDGPNLTAKDYPWTSYLRKWLHAGAKIEYFLQKPSPETTQLFHSLAQDSEKGSLQAYSLKPDAQLNPEEKRRMRAWETFHFALFSSPDLLWLENFHSPGTTVAQQCRFLDARDQESPVYRELEFRWDASKRLFCRL